jgi:hypothetical protein
LKLVAEYMRDVILFEQTASRRLMRSGRKLWKSRLRLSCLVTRLGRTASLLPLFLGCSCVSRSFRTIEGNHDYSRQHHAAGPVAL